MTNLKPTVMSLVAAVLCGFAAVANAIPLVDGKFDPSEGYTDGFWLNLAVESGKTSTVDTDNGRLWLYQDDNNFYVNLTLPLTLVDNTYGENSVGWGRYVAPSGKGLGDITIPLMHVSPNKIAGNKVFGQITSAGQIPEPASMVLLGLGSIGLLPNRRR